MSRGSGVLSASPLSRVRYGLDKSEALTDRGLSDEGGTGYPQGLYDIANVQVDMSPYRLFRSRGCHSEMSASLVSSEPFGC